MVPSVYVRVGTSMLENCMYFFALGHCSAISNFSPRSELFKRGGRCSVVRPPHEQKLREGKRWQAKPSKSGAQPRKTYLRQATRLLAGFFPAFFWQRISRIKRPKSFKGYNNKLMDTVGGTEKKAVKRRDMYQKGFRACRN